MERNEKREKDTNEMIVNDFNRLKILLLTWEYPPHIVGGLARHTEGLSIYLQKNGVEVHVVTTKPEKMTSHYEEVEGVHIHRVEPLNALDNQFLNWIGGLNLQITEKVMKLVSEHKFSLIHAHDWLVGEAAQVLSHNLNIPLITTIHATEYGRHSGIFTELQRFIHNKEQKLVHSSDQLIVCSEFMKDEVSEIFSISKQKIAVIPNGVRMEETKSETNPLHPIIQHEKRNIIFSIGRLVKEKGFDLIIEAAAKMSREDICFVIAGNGPLFHEYDRLIKGYDLENRVYLIGFISDQHRNQFFENSTMAIFPSRYEPFGIVALEAMKFSKPIIVSETGGLQGIIKHFETGLFLKSGDVNSLVDQIEYILTNPREVKKMAENGKKLVDHFYSWQRVAEMTKRIYEEMFLLSKIRDEKNGVNPLRK